MNYTYGAGSLDQFVRQAEAFSTSDAQLRRTSPRCVGLGPIKRSRDHFWLRSMGKMDGVHAHRRGSHVAYVAGT